MCNSVTTVTTVIILTGPCIFSAEFHSIRDTLRENTILNQSQRMFQGMSIMYCVNYCSRAIAIGIRGKDIGGGSVFNLKILVGDVPLNFQGGRKIGDKNQEKERKIKKSSKIIHRQ